MLANDEALRQVLDNLHRQRRALLAAGRRGALPARASDGRVARIEVEDDGVGIPKKELPNVFDRFYQAGRESDRPPPAAPASACRSSPGWCEEMRGAVRASRRKTGRAPASSIDLPAVESARERAAAASWWSRTRTPSPQGVVLNLERKGYAVELARDGKRGARQARGARFDLILLDVRLPEVTASTSCQRLRDEGNFTPDPHAHRAQPSPTT